jgi:hypothetical protein
MLLLLSIYTKIISPIHYLVENTYFLTENPFPLRLSSPLTGKLFIKFTILSCYYKNRLLYYKYVKISRMMGEEGRK